MWAYPSHHRDISKNANASVGGLKVLLGERPMLKYRSGERRGVSPTWLLEHTSGLRRKARQASLIRYVLLLALPKKMGNGKDYEQHGSLEGLRMTSLQVLIG